MKVSGETITDSQIRELRDEAVICNPSLAHLFAVALRSGEALDKGPMCSRCSWRKGGKDSWDGRACKCGLREAPLHRCDVCSGLGRVPYGIGSEPCTSCDGSGLFSATETSAARARCADAWNARHGGGR